MAKFVDEAKLIVRVEQKLLDDFGTACRRHGTDSSKRIRRFMKEYVDKQKE